jgi:hypothetical protein
MHQVIARFTFHADAMIGPSISLLLFSAATTDDMLIRVVDILRKGILPFHYPSPKSLPCVVYVNYINMKNLVKRQVLKMNDKQIACVTYY